MLGNAQRAGTGAGPEGGDRPAFSEPPQGSENCRPVRGCG